MLSEMLRDPEWMQKDRTVILAIGAMYGLFLIALVCGQRKKRTDDRLFADGVRCEYECRFSPHLPPISTPYHYRS